MNQPMNCWICGELATTREHRVKASDLRKYFGSISQQAPIYFHVGSKRNTRVGSVNSDKLKFTNKICNECNSARSRPHDLAWEELSEYLQKNWQAGIKRGRFDLSKRFPGRTGKLLLNVHLYFVKLFGCMITEATIPIDLASFSSAILNGAAHPNIHIAIGPRLGQTKGKYAGMTPVQAVKLGERVVYAQWIYILGDVAVEVIYAEEQEDGRVVRNSWHPSTASRTLRLSDFKVDHTAKI